MFRRTRSRRRADPGEPSRQPPPDPVALRRILPLAAPYWRQLIIAAVCVAVSTVLSLSFPLLIQRMVDSAVVLKDAAMMTTFALAMAAIFIVQSVFNFGQSYLLSFTGERLVADLRKRVFGHLQQLSLGFYDNQRVGELTSRLSSDVSVVQAGLTSNLVGLVGQILTLVGGIIMIVIIDWHFVVLLLFVIPPVMITGALFGRRLQSATDQAQTALGAATTVLEETITAPRVVKAFGRESYEVTRYGTAVEQSFQAGMRRTLIRSFFIAVMTLVSFIALTVIMWYGGNEVLNGNLSPGQLLALPLYVLLAMGPITSLAGVYAQFQESSGASRRIFEILDTTPEIADLPSAVPLRAPALGSIEFRDVVFHYKDGPEVLKHLSLAVAPGEVVALVGPSGAGKTTMVSLIPRFYDVAGGTLLVDGHDVRSLTVDSLRAAIAIVPQEPQLFGGTIYENIAYGRLEAAPEEIRAAARAANAHDFIMELPEGYESLVGERGVKLSGGQRQRIAIARAILRDPCILILDEATSALDNESEALVRQALDRLMAGRTVIIIAHRLSTVERAGKIAVIDHGRVVELGTHSQLLVHEGLYHRLYTRYATGHSIGEPARTDDLEELATREVA